MHSHDAIPEDQEQTGEGECPLRPGERVCELPRNLPSAMEFEWRDARRFRLETQKLLGEILGAQRETAEHLKRLNGSVAAHAKEITQLQIEFEGHKAAQIATAAASGVWYQRVSPAIWIIATALFTLLLQHGVEALQSPAKALTGK